MLFPVWLSHVSRACTAMSKYGVGVEALFWPDFWDRGRACARGGGYFILLDTDCFCQNRMHKVSSGPSLVLVCACRLGESAGAFEIAAGFEIARDSEKRVVLSEQTGLVITKGQVQGSRWSLGQPAGPPTPLGHL